MIGPDASKRVMGCLIGLLFVVVGNYLPKNPDAAVENHCTPSRTQALQRFSGWVFVIMGLGYAFVWLVLPVSTAGAIDEFVIVPAVVLVLGRLAWLYFTCRRTGTNAEA